MSFTRVKPLGWAINEKLTSAQQNQLDIDHVLAVDKTGDEILGNIEVQPGGRIAFGSTAVCAMTNGSILEVQNGAILRVTASGFLTVQAGSTTTFAGSTTFSGTTAVTAGTLTISAGVSTTINSQISVNGLAFFSQPLTCFNNLIMDGDSVPGNIKLRMKDASYLDVENFSKLRLLSGSALDAQSGSTIDLSGTTNHKNGGNEVYQSGSVSTHADGSNEVYESGSILEQKSGAGWLCKGSVTITPTGTLFCSFGGTTSFATTPTFFNGFTMSAGTAAIAGTLSVSAASTFSGTLTTSAAANLAGTTTVVGASNTLKVTSRDVVKRIPMSAGNAEVVYSDGAGGYITTQSPTYIGSSDTLLFQVPTADIHKYNIPIYPPDNAVLKSISFTWSGTCSVNVSIRRNGTSIGSAVAAPTGTVTISPNIAVDTATQSFSIEITAERVGSQDSASFTALFATYTVSEYDPGAG